MSNIIGSYTKFGENLTPLISKPFLFRLPLLMNNSVNVSRKTEDNYLTRAPGPCYRKAHLLLLPVCNILVTLYTLLDPAADIVYPSGFCFLIFFLVWFWRIIIVNDFFYTFYTAVNTWYMLPVFRGIRFVHLFLFLFCTYYFGYFMVLVVCVCFECLICVPIKRVSGFIGSFYYFLMIYPRNVTFPWPYLLFFYQQNKKW